MAGAPLDDLLQAVRDTLAQYELSDAALGPDFEEALDRLQLVYDRVTGQPDYQPQG